jgi:hypothetical protein
VQQATTPSGPQLPAGWGTTANTRVTQPLWRQADPAYGDGMTGEGASDLVYKLDPVNADQYRYPTSAQPGSGGVRGHAEPHAATAVTGRAGRRAPGWAVC